MKDREEGRRPISRRIQDDDDAFIDGEEFAEAGQSIETLRAGYSWIRALQARHPGWNLPLFDEAFIVPPAKPISACRVSLVSLGGVYRKGQKPFNTAPGPVPPALRAMRFRDRGDWSVREIGSDGDPDELLIAHAHYDQSDAEEDINCVFPISRLLELELQGFIGECAPFHYSLMGYVPEVEPLLESARREIIPKLRLHAVDAVVISGGCELSHQSAGLLQREIESAGIPTVAVSVCRDITAGLLVPRAVSLRFPLGNPFGASLDVAMQSRILKDALSQIDHAEEPGTVVPLPYEWIKP